MPNIKLIETTTDHLETLFHFQLDEQARYLAAFTSIDSTDKSAYLRKFTGLLADPSITMRTIMFNGEIAGSVAKYMMDEEPQITFWIGRDYWDRGIATAALTEFLKIEATRPIYGRSAFDNHGSQRVMEKCGFKKIGTDKGYANGRQAEVEEFIYELKDSL